MFYAWVWYLADMEGGEENQQEELQHQHELQHQEQEQEDLLQEK